jgi:hypothetical protein
MAQTEKQLTEQLKAVENDIEAINVQIASDPPETSDLLLELREVQGTYRETAVALRAAIELWRGIAPAIRDVGTSPSLYRK